MLKPLGYHLVWYGAGNAVYVHSTAKRRLGHWAAMIIEPKFMAE
jgi:hypothetical protein